MSIINSQPLIGASGNQVTGYNLTKSLRFRSSASAYLNRTFSGTPQTYTLSVWVKRANTGSYQSIACARSASPESAFLNFTASDTIEFAANSAIVCTSTAVFRDYSAWYHIVLRVTQSGTAYIYVNNQQVASGSVGSTSYLFTSTAGFTNAIGRYGNNASGYFDGYMTEFNFIDGQALTSSSFGETDTITGVWKPKKYTGTYGTNGFYLKFDNLTSTSTLGNDSSGNSNTWTVNNISLTSGSTYDSMTDVPTLTSATTANYCVMSPIASSPLISLTNGNLTAGGTDEASLIGTIGVNSGKWYWEVTVTSGSVTPYLGVSSNSFDKSGSGSNYLLAGISWYGNGLKKAYTGTSSTSATSNTTGVYGFALDISAGTLAYYFNNSLVFTDTTIPTSGVTLFALVAHTNSGSNSWNPANFNFGQQPFAYTPPTGFVALNTFNLPTPTIGATASSQANDYFDATLYTGTTAYPQAITNAASFKPDFVWAKSRSNAQYNGLFDSVRSGYALYSNATDAEDTTEQLTFNSNGFSTPNKAADFINTNGYTYVAWQWRASNATAVTNTAGTITSSVSANTTAGFSIVTYTGTGSTGTVGHGLGVAPRLIIVKNRNPSGTFDWAVYHGANPATVVLGLNDTYGNFTQATWNNTAPTSSVFSVGAFSSVNESTKNIVAYCWSEIAGFSKFDSYTGNGSSDGTFVYTGFRPKFLLFKQSSASGEYWHMMDSTRSPTNAIALDLYPNLSNAEATYSPAPVDFLSNGFKFRTSNGAWNGSGATYIYMALAENPFKYSLAR